MSAIETQQDVAAWLRHYGHMQKPDPIRSAQKYLGVKPDGILGPVTKAAMEIKRCGVPDVLQAGPLCRWPGLSVNWHLKDPYDVGRVTLADQHAIARDVWQAIADACGLQGQHTNDLRDAHVVYTVARFDGPGGVLAQAYLPCGNVSTSYRNAGRVGAGLVQMGRDENWSKDRRQGFTLDYQTRLHETLHACGLPHCQRGQGGGRNVMEPMYDPNVTELGAWDLAELRARYGPRRTQPAPPPVTPPVVPPVIPDPRPGAGWYDLPFIPGVKVRSPSVGGGKVELDW